MHRIRVFTNRYPFLGPWIYILSVQYFIAQFVVAAAWTAVPYSVKFNVISDLGNTVCGQYGNRFVCSPEHGLMNLSFSLLGITMAIGSLFIYQEFKRTWQSLIGFLLMGLSGVGTLLVGIYPENDNSLLHGIGAGMAFGLGNLSLIVLALAITQAQNLFRWYTGLSGVFALIALGLYLTHTYLGLGQGGMERVVAHPQTIWLILFGAYMTATRYRAHRHTKSAFSPPTF